MGAEPMAEHHASQDQYGIHGAVFEIDVLFDPFDAADRQPPDDDGADSVSQQDQRYRQGESESADHSIDREGHVDDFQIDDLSDIGEIAPAGQKTCFLFLGVAFESVGNEEGGRAHDRPEGQHRVRVEGKPDDGCQEDRDNGIEPCALAGDETLDRQTVLFRLQKNPVEEEENEENAPSDKKDGGAFLDGMESCRIAGQARCEGLPGSQPRRHDPDDEPGQDPPDPEDGDQYSPGQEPLPCPLLHGRQDFGVDNGVVDAGDGFKEGKTRDGQ